MTLPRSQLVSLEKTPFYHCMVRCVRHSYLCGINKETGQDYSHRKNWIEQRIFQLASYFAIKICAYAIMSNHYHLIVFINSAQANSWEEQEIIERWAALFPQDAKKVLNKNFPEKLRKEKIIQWRERLSNLSWYMKCLNEPIARFSNEEDNCNGRFWQGRFKSQAILDEGGLLSAMAYVDLNPIRAKIASTPESSEFTSIYERIKILAREMSSNPKKSIDQAKQPNKLMSFGNSKNQNKKEPCIDFKLSDYLKLIDETGRIIREGKKGAISQSLAPILTRLNLTTHGWLNIVKNLEASFFNAIGCETKLFSFCSPHSKGSPKGLQCARRYYLQVT